MNREVRRRCGAADPQAAIGSEGEQIQVIDSIAPHKSEPGESGEIRIQFRDEAVVLTSVVGGLPGAWRSGHVRNAARSGGSSDVHRAVRSNGETVRTARHAGTANELSGAGQLRESCAGWRTFGQNIQVSGWSQGQHYRPADDHGRPDQLAAVAGNLSQKRK